MRRAVFLLSVLVWVALASCTGESAFPIATGKGTIRAINTIKTSPGITFMIEERLISAVEFKNSTGAQQYDDLEYIFNFEVLFAGDTERQRIASQFLDVVKDKEFTFIIGGELADPTITIWDVDVRVWSGTETVFEARFGHTSAALGSIDVYFAAPGVAPASGQEIGTLVFGEVLPAVDYPEGDYVLVYTVAGDPATILFTSEVVTLAEQSAFTISMFDADANELGPMSVRLFSASGSSQVVFEAGVVSTLRFFHTSMALATADIYGDEAVTTLLVSDHAFGNVTGDIPVAPGANLITYTTAGDTGVILFEDQVPLFPGTHYQFYVVGETDALSTILASPDRRSVETRVKFSFLHTATNHASIDVYVILADTEITDKLPIIAALTVGSARVSINLQPGSYDLYLTPAAEQTIITGPVGFDPALGDIVEVIALDAVDPASADIVFTPLP